MGKAWRTVIISEKADLRRKDNCLEIITAEAVSSLSAEQISTIIIESEQMTFSVSLLSFLVENNISVIFCDKKHNPFYETVPYHKNTYFPQRLMIQISWDENTRKEVWYGIISAKIRSQSDLLDAIDKRACSTFRKMAGKINKDNPNETEAQVARIYFRSLYGFGFNRRTDNDINAALNYGYSIILSAVNRIIVAHGYSSTIGIDHHSSRNPFNLSCDIMEPFRPFVDAIVYREKGEFDLAMRKKLLAVLSADVVYDGNIVSLENALESFVLDVIRSLETNKVCLGGIGFDG